MRQTSTEDLDVESSSSRYGDCSSSSREDGSSCSPSDYSCSVRSSLGGETAHSVSSWSWWGGEGPSVPGAGVPSQFFHRRDEGSNHRRERRGSSPSVRCRSVPSTTHSLVDSLMEPMYREVSDPELLHEWRPSRRASRPMIAVSESGDERRNSEQPSRPGTPCPLMPAYTRYLNTIDSGRYDGTRIGFYRQKVRRILASRLFALVSGFVIILNGVVIGIEQAAERKQTGSPIYNITEYLFISFYALEVLAHVFGFGPSCLWENNWVMFDTGVLLMDFFAEVALSSFLHTGKSLLLFRMMRLAPLVRTLRPIVRFRVLKLLVRALLSSAGIMCSTLLLLTIFLYIFGIVGMELIGMHRAAVGPEASGDFYEIADVYFPSISTSMLTLVQFVCLDTVAAIYRPLIVEDAKLAVYFILVTLLVPILLMNMVTGVIVASTKEHILKSKMESQTMERSRLAKQLRDIFSRLDLDVSGEITRQELLNVSPDDKEVLNRATNMADPVHIFQALDPEDQGHISMQEFCDGVWRLATAKTQVTGQRMEGQVTSILRRVDSFKSSQANMEKSLGRALLLQQGLHTTLRLQSAAWRCCSHDGYAHFRRPSLQSCSTSCGTVEFAAVPRS